MSAKRFISELVVTETVCQQKSPVRGLGNLRTANCELANW